MQTQLIQFSPPPSDTNVLYLKFRCVCIALIILYCMCVLAYIARLRPQLFPLSARTNYIMLHIVSHNIMASLITYQRMLVNCFTGISRTSSPVTPASFMQCSTSARVSFSEAPILSSSASISATDIIPSLFLSAAVTISFLNLGGMVCEKLQCKEH
jgi:hypothetical protein